MKVEVFRFASDASAFIIPRTKLKRVKHRFNSAGGTWWPRTANRKILVLEDFFYFNNFFPFLALRGGLVTSKFYAAMALGLMVL